MLYNTIYKTVGNTPMVKIENDNMADIYLKIESFNPGGSIKDRPALYMIEDAERKGLLQKGGTIIEPTSGNMGIGISMIGIAKGYRVIIVMPDTMSIERQELMKAYGAELILTEGKTGMQGSVDLAKKLAEENDYFMPSQFENDNNYRAHYETTALEIIEDLDGKIDLFIAGVGTGGTITGIGKRLKELDEKIKIVAIEPEDSALLSGDSPGPHKIQGIGANFIPKILDRTIIDEVMRVENEKAFEYSRKLGRDYAILSGISSGANFYGAVQMAKKLGKGKNVVTVLPDNGERYLSTDLFR